MPDSISLVSGLKREAYALGFDLVGIASAEPSKYREHVRRWLDEGRGGTMSYLGSRFEERVDPSVYMPGVRSVICVAMNYFSPLADVPEKETIHHAKVARYALGDDYHDVIKDRLYRLADWLRTTAPGVETRCGVDTAPIMERELATRAGIGWIGKNTCVIHPKVGSWILLGEVLTTLDLPSDVPITDHCGTCRRCIDACPTDAISPYNVDARRCISYLTIEHRGEIDEELKPALDEWLFGCDICQEVCPWNHAPPVTQSDELKPRSKTGTFDLRAVQSWSVGQSSDARRKSAIKRVKLPILQRNARTIVANRGVPA